MFVWDFYFMLINLLILLVSVLVGVAYLTLLERKVLGYIQVRKGPNKVGMLGILQPFSDGIKLFSKEMSYPLMSNYFLYSLSPMMNLGLALMLWVSIPMMSYLLSFSLSVIYFFCVSSMSVYVVLMSGWASNSNYSMLGGMRAIAQTISYEVSLILVLMSFLCMVLSFNLVDFMKFQMKLWFIFLTLPLSFILLVSSLAETNRTPFDFSEGESELVSGFNIEYSSGSFALIFLAEYSNILFMSMLCVILFLGCDFFSFLFFMKVVFLSFFWVWVRGTLPRFRFDKLMGLAWKSFLPFSLNMLFFYFGLKLLVTICSL